MTEKQERLKMILGNLSLLIDSLYEELELNEPTPPQYSEVLEYADYADVEHCNYADTYDEVFEG
jgi:hypothetical protein